MSGKGEGGGRRKCWWSRACEDNFTIVGDGTQERYRKKEKKTKKNIFFFFCPLDSLVRDLQMTIFKSTRYYNK